MSAQEIIAELPSLSRPDLQQVAARLHDLLQSNGGGSPAKLMTCLTKGQKWANFGL